LTSNDSYGIILQHNKNYFTNINNKYLRRIFMKNKCTLIIIIVAITIIPSFAFGEPILAPGDFIIAINTNTAMESHSRTPDSGDENVENILDGDFSTKYLNFGGGDWDSRYTGFIVTPNSGSSIMQSFMLTTANDAIERDPASWILYGTTESIVSTNNSNGIAENWTFIDSGTVALPWTRETNGPIVLVNNSTAYTSYRMTFPSLRNGVFDMQFSGVAFYSTTNGTGGTILSTSDAVIAVQTAPASKYNSNVPSNIIDENIDSKYLNFGKENSGFIVTPSYGSAVVGVFEIWTANDCPERDPNSWALFGTTNPIASLDNGRGLAENWTFIDSGSLSLPEDRNTNSGIVIVNNDISYTSYKMIFPTLKDTDTANSMQIAEIQFDNLPEPAMLLIFLGSFYYFFISIKNNKN